MFLPGRLPSTGYYFGSWTLLNSAATSCRLKTMVLAWLPATKNAALGGVKAEAGASPIKTVLRSKGFMWMSNSHVTAFFWSHAGQHFEIRDEGDWWDRAS